MTQEQILRQTIETMCPNCQQSWSPIPHSLSVFSCNDCKIILTKDTSFIRYVEQDVLIDFKYKKTYVSQYSKNTVTIDSIPKYFTTLSIINFVNMAKTFL